MYRAGRVCRCGFRPQFESIRGRPGVDPQRPNMQNGSWKTCRHAKMTSFSRTLLVALGVLWGFGLILFQVHPRYESFSRTTNVKKEFQVAQHDGVELSIRAGELPGYTGWSRPEHTMAPHHKLIQYMDGIRAGDEWRATVSCSHDECRHGGAHFYVRIYGPAVLTGTVQDHRNGTYTIQSWPMDPGYYTVEIVVTFSFAHKWSDYPLPLDWSEPDYEGYMLPDFPLGLKVERSSRPLYDEAICSLDFLIESFEDPPRRIRRSRWVVVDKVGHPDHRTIAEVPNGTKRVSLLGYQEGINSLGIWMTYMSRACSLLPWPGSYQGGGDNCLHSTTSNNTRPLHVIFVGDSVMSLQKNVFDTRIAKGTVKTTHVDTSTGIVRSFSAVTENLMAIARSNPTDRRVVLFNSGLHDISNLCNHKWSAKRLLYMNVSDETFSCPIEYHSQLKRLVDFISDYPAEFRVFQSTTAGWPKYGNYGFAWPPREPQPFPSSPNFVAHMNDLAFDVIQQHNNRKPGRLKILVMDGYWITLARPDNREVNGENAIGKHMVHPGKEVLRAMVRIWWMILLYGVSSDCVVDPQ